MLSTLTPKSLSALAVLMLLGSPAIAGARDKAKSASDVTGAIAAAAPAAAKPADAPVAIHARDAQQRLSGARAAMEHALLLRENAPKSDIAAIETNMKGLLEDLDAIESKGYADSVKEARRLARDWHDTGMQILKPPAVGLTEVATPISVASKADDLGTAIEWLVAETAATKAPAPNAMASASPTPAAPVAAPDAATKTPAPDTMALASPTVPLPVAAPSAAAKVTSHPVHGKQRTAAASPMTQNEASARLLHDGLPLIFPPAALFIRKGDSSRR